VSADKENTLILTLDTGVVTIELLPNKAPGHVERIKELAREGFYDGVVFHRVIDGFMAQGGDPTGSGMGGSEKDDLRAEFNDVSHQRGVCSMARSNSPNSANSQFFICLDDLASLPPKYTIFGMVTSGLATVDVIAKGATGPGDRPLEPVKMTTVTIG